MCNVYIYIFFFLKGEIMNYESQTINLFPVFKISSELDILESIYFA